NQTSGGATSILPYLSLICRDSLGDRFALAVHIELEIDLMGRIQRSRRRHVQALSKQKIKTLNEIEELRDENRKLRELVAHLAKLVLVRMTAAIQSEEEAADADASSSVNSD